jgi:hypothetical protein
MIKPWVLDTGPLGRLTLPSRNPQIVIWLERSIEIKNLHAPRRCGGRLY